MSLSLAQLLAQMRDKSLTYGWDALVLYDQRKTNELLFQLYVERINSENGYIEPMSMVAAWGGGSYKEYIHDLRLSAPRLSFENADPSLPARARLTMDMIGGMIVSAKKNPGGPFYISKLLQILPVGGPQLWMDQPVTKAVVNGVGDVVMDLSKADNFKANFVLGELAQEQVGQRFKEYFRNRVPTELKIFPLGRLDGEANGILTPLNFEVRVTKSDPLALMGDEQYGKGAVMLFITLVGGRDGTGFPDDRAPYLIPADGNGHTFTGTLLLSSRVIAEKVLKPALEGSIGNGLTLNNVTSGHVIASSLKAVAGGGNIYDNRVSYQYWQGGSTWGHISSATSTLSPFPYDFTSGSGLVVTLGGSGSVVVAWRGSKSGVCSAKTVVSGGPAVFDFTYTYDMKKAFFVSLDPQSNHVELGNPVTLSDSYDVSFSQNPMPVWNRDGRAVTGNFIINKARSLVRGMLNRIEVPSIDTFLLKNLLFPGHNALHLTEAFIPGDLAVFGQIDPLRTHTQLSPDNSTVQAGSGFQFYFTPAATNVTWTARDIDQVSMPEVVSSSGYFTAPRQEQIPQGFLAIVVTAQGLLNGTPVQSSALVTVLGSMILTNPLYDSCGAGETRQLSAESLGGGTLQWNILTPQWGSTLAAVAGEPTKRTYIAGGSSDNAVPFSLDEIEVRQTSNGQVSHIHILIHNQAVTTPLWISEASEPASGTVQFELRPRGEPVDPSRVIWKLLDGPGTFDERTGIYQEPASLAPSSFIVVSGTIPDDFQDVQALAAIPLPLSKYAGLMDMLQEDAVPIDPEPPLPIPIPTGFRLTHNNYYPIQFQWNASDKAVKYRLYRWWVPIADVIGIEYTSSVQGYNRFHLRAVDAAGRLSERTDYVFFFPPGYLPSEVNDLPAGGKGN